MGSKRLICLAAAFVFVAINLNTARFARAADITHNTNTVISTATSGDRHIIGTNGVTLTINADTTGINNNGIKLEDISNGTVIVGSGVTVSVTQDAAIDAESTTNAIITNSGTISSGRAKTIELEARTGATSGATVNNNFGGTITDANMTRFWITLEQGVNFVLSSLEMMEGGKIFIPKIPSMKMTDLADAIAPGVPTKVIGIRPGEKLHEIMITRDDARNTVELDDRYVILPSFNFWSDSSPTPSGTNSVSDNFEHSSDTNTEWMSAKTLNELC